MRTRMSWVLTVFGVLCAVAGLAVMLILGPDSRFSTGPHKVETDGIAVVTAPKVITWADVRIDVLAEVPVQKPIFVGLGNAVDVQNLVGETSRLEVTDFHTPWKVKTRQIPGKPGLPGAPTALDWWLADSAGRGGASISTTLPDETVSLAILSVGDSTLAGLEVSLAYGISGGFAKGVGLLLLGAGAVLLSLLVRRGESIWSAVERDVEDVVYVYVDEEGVEHEISAEEAEDYEIVEVVEVVEDLDESDEATEEEVPEDEEEEIVYIYVDADGVEREITAEEAENYEFIDEVVVDVEDESQDDPEEVVGNGDETEGAETDAPARPEAPAPDQERVMYVFIDEDGVEHEVTEEELADFEVVDEEEGKP